MFLKSVKFFTGFGATFVLAINLLFPDFTIFLSNMSKNILIKAVLMFLDIIMWNRAAVFGGYYALIVLIALLAYLQNGMNQVLRKKDFKRLNQARVLERLMNSFLRRRIVLAIISSCALIEILMGSVLLAAGGVSIIIAVFAIYYVEILLFLIVFLTFAANIYSQGLQIVRFYGKESNTKFEKKVCSSIMSMRIEFGNNFIDRLTPLVIQEKVTGETVSFSLLLKSR